MFFKAFYKNGISVVKDALQSLVRTSSGPLMHDVMDHIGHDSDDLSGHRFGFHNDGSDDDSNSRSCFCL